MADEAHENFRDAYLIGILSIGCQGDHGILTKMLGAKLEVNGMPLEVSPFEQNGCMVAPAQQIFQATGVAVTELWDGHEIIASTKRHTLEITDLWLGAPTGQYHAIYDGKWDDNEVKTANGQALLPVSESVSFFGGGADWDPLTQTMSINSEIPVDERMNDEELEELVNFSWEDAAGTLDRHGYEYVIDIFDDRAILQLGKKCWLMLAVPKGVTVVWNEMDSPHGMIRSIFALCGIALILFT